MARRRYQKGSLSLRGKSWVLRWREDVIESGQIRRVYRREVIGTVADYATRRLAFRAAEARLSLVNDPRYRARPTATLAEFAARWESTVLCQLKPSTRINYRSHLHKHLVPFFGSYQVKDIQPELVQRFLSTVKASPKTLRNVSMTLRSLWRSARAWGYVAHDAMEGVVMPKPSKPRPFFFTLEEAQKVIAGAQEPYRTFYWLAAETGMRAGELCGLQVGDVDLEAGVVFIRQSAWQGRLQSPKTGGAVRSFSLSPDLVEHLRSYLSRWRPNPLQLLFATRNGTPWEPKKPRSVLHHLLAQLRIQRGGLHAFRHGNETLMDRLGVPLAVRQQRLGHTDARTTLEVYTHSVGEDHRRVAAKLGRILNPFEPKPAQQPEGQLKQLEMIH